MGGARAYAAAAVAAALVVTTCAETQATADVGRRSHATVAARSTLPAGFGDATAIGGLSEPVSTAFAPDGTAFVALKTGEIKSFDFDAATGQFEPASTSSEFADLSVEVDN